MPGGRGGGGSRFFTHATSGREALVGVEDDSCWAAAIIGAVIEARVPRVVRIYIVARDIYAVGPGLLHKSALEAPEQLFIGSAGAVEVEGRVSYTSAHERRVDRDVLCCCCRELRDLRTRVVLAVVLGRREG